MAPRSLRRSRRAPKKNSDYNVDDIVEVHRHDGVVRAKLAQLLTEGTSPNPRWLITLLDPPFKDEEVYEHIFGKVLNSDEESQAADSQSPADSGDVPSDTMNGKSSQRSRSDSHGTSSEGETGDEGKDGSSVKNDTMDVDENGMSDLDSSSMNGSKRGRVSAREARSRRRQAKIDDTVVVPPPLDSSVRSGKRRAPLPPVKAGKKSPMDGNGGNVVKVKYLTGTLYLYRGKRRRAEFVRRV
eukprot:Nitzschia sp. Nitz4//scaffold8_size234185//111215//112026//NITZ4_001262-RA/size234185-augustus-gene-0.267-mRNA-1//-1//CDS//3329559821//7887//frame0